MSKLYSVLNENIKFLRVSLEDFKALLTFIFGQLVVKLASKQGWSLFCSYFINGS